MRQLILEKQTIKNGLITLGAKDFKYLRQVLRVKTGDMLNVRLQDGSLQTTTVTSIDDKSKKIILQICANPAEEKTITRGVQATQTQTAKNLADHEYWLIQFLPRPQKFEQIVRQATECGVAVIVPIIGEYSEKSSVTALEGNRKERLIKIVREARQQSGSPIDTKVMQPVTLEKAVELWQEADGELGIVLSERNDRSKSLKQAMSSQSSGDAPVRKVAVAVGSEGGISPEEISTLLEKGLFHAVHFSVNILRCETAALYGLAAVQSALE